MLTPNPMSSGYIEAVGNPGENLLQAFGRRFSIKKVPVPDPRIAGQPARCVPRRFHSQLAGGVRIHQVSF